MCDGLDHNLPKEFETLLCRCVTHARRGFVDVAANFPEEVRFVLNTLKGVYKIDARARQEGLTPEARLKLHQDESAPLMEGLRSWMRLLATPQAYSFSRLPRRACPSCLPVKRIGHIGHKHVPWLPYPRLVVAELEPPTGTKTSWDFSLIDPLTRDFSPGIRKVDSPTSLANGMSPAITSQFRIGKRSRSRPSNITRELYKAL